MPDVIAVGVLVKPVDALNVTVDFRRVQYSQLISEMGLGFAVPGVDRDDYVLDDGNEFRAAGEYLFTNLPSPLSAIAIRGGVWHDPDHRIRYEGAVPAPTPCSSSRARARCTSPSAAASCSRRRSSTSASIAPRR